jgi:hypothetical protein
MESLPNGKRQRDHSIALDEYRMNIEMWRHFDGLRQQKNSAFLTAQGFLIAAVAIAFQAHQSSHSSSRLISGTAQQIEVGGLVLWSSAKPSLAGTSGAEWQVHKVPPA